MILSESHTDIELQDTSPDYISSEEEKDIVRNILILKTYLKSQNIGISSTKTKSSGRLSKLSIRHLIELACDMCDELDRREKKYFTRLTHKSSLGTKRNSARSKMADFTQEKLCNLILDVVLEITKRNLSFFPSEVQENTRFENSTDCSISNDLSTPTISKKPRSISTDILKPDCSFFSKSIDLSYSENYSGIDYISAFIEDIGSMLEKEDGNAEQLKQKYELEISKYKQLIENYETVIIPGKNREISTLMTRLEEGDLLNLKMKKEIEDLTDLLKNCTRIIENQKSAYDTINAALHSNQVDFSKISDQLAENARDKALREIFDSNIFTFIAEHFSCISSAVEGLENILSDFNQKSCLKFLHIIATSGKFIIVNMDRTLRVASLFDLVDIVIKGDQLKSSFIANLSLILVSGKDFSSRPTYSMDFKTNLENLKYSNEEFSCLKIEIESILKNIKT